MSIIWIVLLFIPIFINILGLFCFISALKTKKVQNGVSEKIYDNLIQKPEREILLFEIGANRDSIANNHKMLTKQERKLKLGLNLSLIGIMSFTVFYFINLIT